MQVYSFRDLVVSCIFFVCLAFLSWRLGKRFKIWQSKGVECTAFGFLTTVKAVVLILAVTFVASVLIGLGVIEASFIAVFFLSLAKAILLLFLVKKKLHNLWIPKDSTFYKEFGFGMLLWLFVFPYVGFVNTALRLLYKALGVSIEAKQSVVLLYERTLHSPVDMWLTTFVIVLAVPLIEEIFFRGILQGWLTKRLGAKIGILLTMFVFVISHFTIEQGLGNIEILLTLTVLSFFLSLVYHQRGSLWASLGLHVIFNAISVVFILVLRTGTG